MKTIYHNGRVYTGKLPLAEAFVVENGLFTYSGSNETAMKMASAEDKYIDLN